MSPTHKYTFGVLLLLVGGLWCFSSLIWLPPVSLFIATFDRGWVENTHWLLGLDFSIGIGLIISGSVFLKKSRKDLSF